ncbi:MAG: radical SAM protein [Dehalococcoidia bacterium]
MRIGILELMRAERRSHWAQRAYTSLVIKQYASIMPQTISVWCRELGHQVFYATYFGQKDPKRLLPDDLDVVFISTYTQASALAYALAKLYRRENTLTVIGGPHARAFPDDCLRFFDVVVRECDKTLIAEILSDAPGGEIITSGRALQDIPSVQERMPEIRASAFWRGRPYPTSCIPMLTSIGCPYTCNFCVDWSNPYVLLPLDRLEADLRFILKNFPGVFVGFHDPNFAVKFDQVFAVLERLPDHRRNWYMMESSLSILRGPRLERLHNTGCFYVAPGVESWMAYSNKSGTRPRGSARRKLDQVVEHFKLIGEYVPGIQANFIFGLDVDEGDEPVELTKEFITRLPFVWPTVNIPIPFGATPLYDQYLHEGRILKSMPFTFYYQPYLVTTVKNYSPVTYYEKLVELLSHITSRSMLLKRLRATSGRIRIAYLLRTLSERASLRAFQVITELLKTDRQVRAFHEGESQALPEFYHHQYERLLGPYATLLSREDRQPVLLHSH